MIGGSKLHYGSSEHLAGGRGIVGDGVSDIHADIIVLRHVGVEWSARCMRRDAAGFHTVCEIYTARNSAQLCFHVLAMFTAAKVNFSADFPPC